MGSRNPLYIAVFRASSRGQMIPSERGLLLVVRSPMSVPGSGVNRRTKYTAIGARRLFGQGIGQHESHH
jgi:hypothetical protein